MLTCTKPEMVALLGEFIRSTSDARELKRALAVKMAIEGKPYREIAELLEVYKSFITRWKQEFYEKGIEGLKLGYHGRKSNLLEEERQEIIDWLQTKDYWNLDELITHIDTNTYLDTLQQWLKSQLYFALKFQLVLSLLS